MNILITGASGFLGRHLSVFLENKGHNVTKLTSKQIDLTNQESCENIPKKKYDQIFHLAAWTRAGNFCENHQGEQWIINQLINSNTLNWWKINCPSAKMISFGTSASYSSNKKLIESNYLKDLPLDKYYSYAMSKRMLYVGLESLNKQYDMNYLYFVPSTIYGPNYHTDGRDMHFIYDIIKKILDYKYFKKEIKLWGDGNQIRELIYIDDIVKQIDFFANNTVNQIINLGSGQPMKINYFAQICCEIIEVPYSKVSYDINGFVGNKSKYLDTTYLKSNSSINLTKINDGLRSTIEWFERQHY